MAELPRPGAHGGDVRRLAAWTGRAVEEMLDLSISLNPVAPNVARVVEEAADEVRHYPDATDATEILAAAIGVDPGLVVLTNGGSEAIALVASMEGRGAIVEPEFSLYRRHLPRVAADAPRWRSNPSNPLGTFAAPDARARVWDEAFYPFSAGEWSRGDSDSSSLSMAGRRSIDATSAYSLLSTPEADSALPPAVSPPEASESSSVAASSDEPPHAASDTSATRHAVTACRDGLLVTMGRS